MTTPDSPFSCPTEPDIAGVEDPAAVVAQHGGLHPDALEDSGTLSLNVHNLLFDVVGVNDVIREDFKPTSARHDCWRRLHEDKREVDIKHFSGQCRVSSLDRRLKLIDPLSKVAVHRGILPRPGELLPPLSTHSPAADEGADLVDA